MYDTKLRYLASVFVDARDVQTTTRVAQDFAEALNRDDLTSMTVMELGTGGAIPRLGFRTRSNDWLLVIQTQRIDFSRVPTEPRGANMGDFGPFCTEAAQILGTSLAHLGRNANRVALVQEGLLPEMNPDRLAEVANKLLKVPPTYKDVPLEEWAWQCIAMQQKAVGNLHENINVVTKISRIHGELAYSTLGEQPQVLNFDRVRVDLDLNTAPSNVVPRFDTASLASFMEAAFTWHSALEAETISFLA
jgi:hypothetical protein